jgi:hypothetical protein
VVTLQAMHMDQNSAWYEGVVFGRGGSKRECEHDHKN